MNNDALRPASISPTYPPYHTGEYIEEYFFKRWNEEIIQKVEKIFFIVLIFIFLKEESEDILHLIN